MFKQLIILGSTGSVGTQSLDVARRLGIEVTMLAAQKNSKLLEEQCREFKPKICYIGKEKYLDLKTRLQDTNIKIITGDSLEEAVYSLPSDVVLNSIMGISGLKPTLAAIEGGKHIALANKETLVAGGDLVMEKAKKKNVKILPVDSEHSAIFQCLQNNNPIKRIFLTASGGPFFGKTREELINITPADALKHPNWVMGQKITIDSSTLMNKGFELIEAVHLFNLKSEQIEVIIHRESIIHSMVEFEDNSVIAQLSNPDMRLCVQYALTYPHRYKSGLEKLDLFKLGSLTFKAADEDTFTLLKLAKTAINKGGNIPAAMNGANEKAVELFLANKIKYLDIFDIVEQAAFSVRFIQKPTLEDILNTDRNAREFVTERFN